ncbi:MAG: ABC transporter permease [Bacteroidales bacterium]|nr:ABC transporter permease [Bacteroidales bacterium]
MKEFIIKEFKQIFRDYRTMTILFGIPIAQVLLFGFALTMDLKNVHFAVLDLAKDEHSRKIIDKMDASDYFIFDRYLSSFDEIETVFKEGIVKEVIVFEPNFSQILTKENSAQLQIIADASDPNVANILVNYTQAIITNYQQNLFADNPLGKMVRPEPMFKYNPALKSVYMFVPGIITVILLLVSAMMTSISIAREKELGTMEVLLVSPIKPIQIIVGKVIPYMVLSFLNFVIILLLSFLVFDMPSSGNMPLLLAETFLYIFMSLALGIFISTVSSSQQTAMMLSMFALLLPTILLSGFIFPIKNMPDILIWISHIMPSKWFIIIIKGIMLKGAGLMDVWFETLIILAQTIFFIILSIKKFKIRLT